jgi:hypothetical protein
MRINTFTSPKTQDEVILAKGQLVGVHLKDALPQIIRGVPF